MKLIDIYPEEELLIADGFDDAIIGVDEKTMRVVYSVQKCINVLMERDNMDEDSAMEFFNFNVEGAYVGEKTPIWCWDIYSKIDTLEESK